MTARPTAPVPPEGGGEIADIPWRDSVPESSRRMMEAAVDAFAERGYHATTTRDIATRVGLSPAALYVHFPSKQALLTRISVFGHEAALRLVRESIASAPDPLGQLRAVVGRCAAWYAVYHLVTRVVQQELSALADDDRRIVLGLRQQVQRAVQQVLEDGVAAGVMEVDDPRAVARAVLSLTVDVARWYDPRGKETPDGIGALYAELAVRMVTVGRTGNDREEDRA